MEVHEAWVVTLNVHLNNTSDHISRLSTRHPKWLWQFSEEIVQIFLLHASTLISSGILKPLLLERLKLLIEILEDIFLGEIIIIELLYDDENEEIEHDVGADNHKGEEVNRSDIAATVDPTNAVISSMHTILHNPIPILACRDPK